MPTKEDPLTSMSNAEEKIQESKSKETEDVPFRRLIGPNSIFGVEELLAECPYRLFSARVKSEKCSFYELPREKIIIDLMVKNPDF